MEQKQPDKLQTKRSTRLARDIAKGRVRLLNGRRPIRIPGARRRPARARTMRRSAVAVRAPNARKNATKVYKPVTNSESVATAERSLDAWTNLSPLAQHEVTVLRPGEFNTPFVEANGIASKLSTSVMNGQFSTAFSGSTLGITEYMIVSCCPMAALTGTTSSSWSGFGVVSADDTDIRTMSDLRGVGFSNAYGSTAFASKIIPYATRLEITAQLPLGNLSGSIYTGCIPMSTFISSDTLNLIRMSTQTIDAKSLVGSPRISLKAAINDRALIHFINNNKDTSGNSVAMPTPGELGSEWVAYAIFSKVFGMTYDGSTAAVIINITAHSNTVWWPAVNSPALAGIVAKASASTAATTPSQDHFSKVAETYQADSKPWTLKGLTNVVDSILKKATYVPGISAYAAGARELLSMAKSIIGDPLNEVEDYSSLIADLSWFNSVVDSKWIQYTDPDIVEAVDDWIVSSDNLLSVAESKRIAVDEFIKACKRARQVVKHERGGIVISYLDDDSTPVTWSLFRDKARNDWLKEHEDPVEEELPEPKKKYDLRPSSLDSAKEHSQSFASEVSLKKNKPTR